MANDDWVTVGEYPNVSCAEVGSGLLTSMGVPHRIWPRIHSVVGSSSLAPFYIWVAPEDADEAKRILTEAPISDEELSDLALREPRPDDA